MSETEEEFMAVKLRVSKTPEEHAAEIRERLEQIEQERTALIAAHAALNGNHEMPDTGIVGIALSSAKPGEAVTITDVRAHVEIQGAQNAADTLAGAAAEAQAQQKGRRRRAAS